jgi:hypothetical protein
VNVEQEPFRVTACYCDFCQKRTGSVFYIGAYFIQGAGIEIKGETQIYNGVEIDGVGTTTGDEINYHFCPTCGSTVFYTVKGHPVMGIAVGSFVDPSFPTPTMEFNVGMRPIGSRPSRLPSSSRLSPPIRGRRWGQTALRKPSYKLQGLIQPTIPDVVIERVDKPPSAAVTRACELIEIRRPEHPRKSPMTDWSPWRPNVGSRNASPSSARI